MYYHLERVLNYILENDLKNMSILVSLPQFDNRYFLKWIELANDFDSSGKFKKIIMNEKRKRVLLLLFLNL